MLIAAKRSDQTSGELAQHDYDASVEAEAVIENLAADVTARHEEHGRQSAALRRQRTASASRSRAQLAKTAAD